MDKKIIVFCGKKKTGKSSGAKFVTGYCLKLNGVIDGFAQDEDGELLVQVPSEKEEKDWCVLDVYRKDEEFLKWANNIMFPHVQVFSFATELKEAVIKIFGIERELVYGTDDDKNTKTHIKWSDIRKLIGKDFNKTKGNLTIRDLLQIFGTEICRVIDDGCWIKSTFKKIKDSQAKVCIIDDCRFENELLMSKEENAHLILLKHNEPETPTHSSETFEFSDNDMSLVIYKDQNSLLEKNKLIEDNLLNNKILSKKV